MTEPPTEEELLIIHDALCFAMQNDQKFIEYIGQRNGPKIMKTWRDLHTEGGGNELTGKVFNFKWELDK